MATVLSNERASSVNSPLTSYAAAYCDLPYLNGTSEAFTVPLLSPPIALERCGAPSFLAFGGDNFNDTFGTRSSRSKGSFPRKDYSQSQEGFARVVKASAAVRRFTKPEWSTPTSISQHKPGSIGLEDGFIESLLASCSSDDEQGIESPRIPELGQGSRTRSNSSGPGSRSPRSRTLVAPGEFIEHSFHLPDTVLGPATFWQMAQRPSSPSREAEPVRLLANLHADLCRLRASESGSTKSEAPRRAQKWCDDAIAQADAREGEFKRAAKAELERTEQRLKALDAAATALTAKAAVVEAATSKASSSTSIPLQGQTGSAFAQFVPKAGSVQNTVGAASEGEAFLADNRTKDGIVALPSGLQYKVLKSGDGKFHPKAGSPCCVNYTGTFIDRATEFDASMGYVANPLKVIKGWREALQLMVEGDKWELYVPPSLAYGAAGVPSLRIPIPGNATLIFQMELVEIKGEKVEAAKASKTYDANVKRWRDAKGRFTTAPETPSDDQASAVQHESHPVDGILHHAEIIKKYMAVQEEVDKFKTIPAEKDFRSQIKKTVNKAVAQISANAKSIRECSNTLCDLSKQVYQGGNAERIRFLEYMVAYRLQDEAEVGVRSSAKAAWPIAYMAAQIFQQFPAIDVLFQGMMHSQCPYLAPDYSRVEQSSSAEKMVGYQRLWLAVAVVRGDLGMVWQWLARTMNSSPVPLVASLLHCAMEMAGSAAHARYKRQFVKLVTYLKQFYLPALTALKHQTSGDDGDRLKASISRLEVWITSFERSGLAPEPDGKRIEARQESELNPNM
mmetsp:Transcript_77175/g.120637  ORF Transcript_77175/g.120637 Transcript_77175/m.120637 type:complete len:791 (+) Transcript_77175:49-2421(+)